MPTFATALKIAETIVLSAKSRHICAMPKMLWLIPFCLTGLLLSTTPALADWPAWKLDLQTRAAAEGISAGTINTYLPQLQYLPEVIRLDHQQPEGKLSFADYYKPRATRARIKLALSYYQQYQDTLQKIEQTYGVPPSVILALWAQESDFGQQQGNTPTLSSLATLAYEGRREELFRRELMQAFALLDAHKINPVNLKGSWAGAMGQTQFMPSSFARAAVDFNGDGLADIWHNVPDVLASIAHLLQLEGWQTGAAIFTRVKLQAEFDADLLQNNPILPSSAWHAAGITQNDGNLLPVSDLNGNLVQPDGLTGQSFLVYQNFRAIYAWNHSINFALTTALLAEKIEAAWQAQP